MQSDLKLRAGDWVEVRSKEDILRTLDGRGQLESLPFMPEMFQYCGQRFQVFKRAHKTCDPPSGLQARRLANGVHLTDVRCDGNAHGGCQAGCLIFWKEAWLKKVDRGCLDVQEPASGASVTSSAPGDSQCTERDVFAGSHEMGELAQAGEPTYVCQSTRLYAATTPMRWWEPWQYFEDLSSGNARLSQIAAALLFSVYHTLTQSGLGLGSAMRWVYDKFQRIRGGAPYPWRYGKVPKGMRTPSEKLDLKVGELVRVRSYAEILETLDQNWRNRGMYFDAEHVPFCGGTYRVFRRVEKLIDEKTGKMLPLKSDAIILQDVACQARYAKCRRFCSRSIFPYWREMWLERVVESSGTARQPSPAHQQGAR